jgi:ketosteroid isomerase-like protein
MVKTSKLLTVVLFTFALAHAQDAQIIVAMENAWNLAELHRDASAVGSLLTEDFVMTVAEGTVLNKAQLIASLQDADYEPQLLQSEKMTVHFYGTTAIVTGTYHEKGLYHGKLWERRGQFTDTWIFLNGRWQCGASHFSVPPKAN